MVDREAAIADGSEGPWPRLLGERLCLNFANTLDPRLGDRPRDVLTGYAALVGWARYAALLTEDEARRLLREAARRPADAATAFAAGITLRETIYRVFLAVARGTSPAPADLDLLRRAHVTALGHARLAPSGDGFSWDWVTDNALDRPLWPIARSATELLTSGQLNRVKQCATPHCGWLFLDTSKNASRRWCSMEGCGARAKMRRQYARRRAMGSRTAE